MGFIGLQVSFKGILGNYKGVSVSFRGGLGRFQWHLCFKMLQSVSRGLKVLGDSKGLHELSGEVLGNFRGIPSGGVSMG